jgi:hypothetical protein
MTAPHSFAAFGDVSKPAGAKSSGQAALKGFGAPVQNEPRALLE